MTYPLMTYQEFSCSCTKQGKQGTKKETNLQEISTILKEKIVCLFFYWKIVTISWKKKWKMTEIFKEKVTDLWGKKSKVSYFVLKLF